jgi:DoxX-like family
LDRRIISGLLALLFVLDGVGHLMKPAPVVEAFARLGYPLSASVGIGLLALICTALYVTPRTSVLGAILLTGYLAGLFRLMCALGLRCSRRSFR